MPYEGDESRESIGGCERSESPRPVEVRQDVDDRHAPRPRRQTPPQPPEEVALTGSDRSKKIGIARQSDQGDTAVGSRRQDRGRAGLERGKRRGERAIRREDVATGHDDVGRERAGFPGRPLQAIPERGSALGDPEDVGRVGERAAPRGPVFGGRGDRDPRPGAGRDPPPLPGHRGEEVGCRAAGQSLLARLRRGSPGEDDEKAIGH